MCLFDLQIARLVTVRDSLITAALLSTTIIPENYQRIAYTLFPDQVTNVGVVFSNNPSPGGQWLLMPDATPFHVHYSFWGGLSFKAFSITGMTGTVNCRLLEYTIPERVLAALPPAPGLEKILSPTG